MNNIKKFDAYFSVNEGEIKKFDKGFTLKVSGNTLLVSVGKRRDSC
jgi:hypothetical protein